MLLIIDGASMITANYFALGYGKLEPQEDNGEMGAIHTSLLQIRKYLNGHNPEYFAFVFDRGRNTFRKDIYPEYKAQRAKCPVCLKRQSQEFESMLSDIGIKMYSDEHYEGDDYAASLTRRFEKETDVRIITRDHDYLQLVNDHVNIWMPMSKINTQKLIQRIGIESAPGTPENMYGYDERAVYADLGVFPTQVPDLKGLQGDTSDNIPGVKGISASAPGLLCVYGTIEALYEDLENRNKDELWNIWKVLACLKKNPYNSLSGQKEIALLSKQLATMKTDLETAHSIDELSVSHINRIKLDDQIQNTSFR